jgi:predicted cobalt transporter CbtA
VLATVAYIAAVAVAQALLPDVNEVPLDFPAVVLWHFRIASLETQAILWGTLGLTFGYLCEHAEARPKTA